MAPPQIPAQVLRFLEECIDSVPQLEALLIMLDEPARFWTSIEMGARIYVSESEASRVLDRLARRELIEADDAGNRYRIQAADGAKSALIEEVARTYRENLTRIATFIHEKPPASVKEFARAFDLKKDP